MHCCYLWMMSGTRGCAIPIFHSKQWKKKKRKEKYLKSGWVDTNGNCQRLVFTVCVSQHMHKTNLWKFELNRSSKLRDNYKRKNTLVTRSCVLSNACISRPQILNLGSRNHIHEKLLLSRKLLHFRGSCFSQCFVLSTSPHYS